MHEIRWPAWWDWELEFSDHSRRRMGERGASEVEVRTMFADACRLDRDVEWGRWVVTARHHGAVWEVIVEPDLIQRLIVVVTAYPLD